MAALNQEHQRMARHLSEVNPHHHRQPIPQDLKITGFPRDSRASPLVPPPAPYSPRVTHTHRQTPLPGAVDQKDTIYTASFSKPFRKLNVLLSPRAKDQMNDRSMEGQSFTASCIDTRSRQLGSNQDWRLAGNTDFRPALNLNVRQAMQLSPMHNFKKGGGGTEMSSLASPQHKVKLIKSLEHSPR
jgi:hypothetical protein